MLRLQKSYKKVQRYTYNTLAYMRYEIAMGLCSHELFKS